MAYFKITLLTPYTATEQESNSAVYESYFLEDTITEFYPQIQKYKTQRYSESNLIDSAGFSLTDDDGEQLLSSDISFANRAGIGTTSFTYKEEISFGLNSQKTLSFSMNKYIVNADEYTENPFVNLIQVGTQLLLTDQYSNEYFFTVSNIKYTFKETNIVYDVTCQDSFSYQTSRQNQNYFIDNDASSEDFIGAKTADWWIVHKVVPECYLSNYQYIPCSRVLYESTSGKYIICNAEDIGSRTDVLRIIKEGHTWDETDDFYQTFAYSCSGMNADSVLIDIASKINMQLQVFEHSKMYSKTSRTKYFDRFFWLEPIKNDRRTGLTYSPYRDISSFDLTHNGQSLTTMLNVSGPTYNDEIITLIPDIPAFFNNFFIRPEWNTTDYSEGFFTQACLGKTLYSDDTLSSTDVTDTNSRFLIDSDITYKENFYDIKDTSTSSSLSGIFIRIYDSESSDNETTIEILSKYSDLYNHFRFIKDQYESEIRYSADDSTITASPLNGNWVLAQVADDTNNYYNIYRPGVNFESEIDNSSELFLVILTEVDDSETLNLEYAKIYLNLYRDTTEEEIEFATIADKCPWLENKLIDFNYFKDQNIISQKEYNQLIYILKNDLRKVNGRLMYYSQAYYKALKDRVELISNLTNQLDSLGAACQAAIIDPIAEKGSIQDITYFENAYTTVFNSGVKELTFLLDYDLLVSDYFNKYFNAQQRFLKNLYNFKKYFNAKNPLEAEGLYKYTLHIEQPSKNEWSGNYVNQFYGFKEGKFISLSNSNYPYRYYGGYGVDGDNTEADNYGEPFLPVFLNQNGKIQQVAVASNTLWKTEELYCTKNFAGSYNYCATESTYSEDTTYLKTIFKVPIKYDSNEELFYWNTGEYINKYSTKNYQKDVDTPDNINVFSGLYWVIINGGYGTLCKMITITKNDSTYKIEDEDQYYAILQQVHQGQWVKDATIGGTEGDYDIFTNEFSNWDTATSMFTKLTSITITPVWYYSKKYAQVTNWSAVYSEEASIGLTPATVSDIKTDWLYKNYTNEYIYIKESPIYTSVGTFALTRAYNQMRKFAPYTLFLLSALGKSLTDDDDTAISILLSMKPVSAENSNYTDITKKLYYKNFPITDFYEKAPRYYISQTTENNTVKYLFQRLNEKNQSFADYLNYIYDTSEYAQVEVKNPYSFTEYKQLFFVDESNESTYYRRTLNSSFASAETVIDPIKEGIFKYSEKNTIGLLQQEYISYPQTWNTEGITNLNFFGDEIDDGAISGFDARISSTTPIYATSESSYQNCVVMLNAFKEQSTKQTVLEIDSDSVDEWENNLKWVPWKTATLNSNNKITLNKDWTGTSWTDTDEAFWKNGTVSSVYRNAILSNNIAYTLKNLECRKSSNPVYFIDKKVEPLTSTSTIYETDSLLVLISKQAEDLNDAESFYIFDETAAETFFNDSNKVPFSASLYWPLVSQMAQINIKTIDWTSVNSYTLEDILKETLTDTWGSIDSSTEEGEHGITFDNGTWYRKAYFFRLWDHAQTSFADAFSYPDNIAYSIPRIYDTRTRNDFNILEQVGVVSGFYVAKDFTDTLILANEKDDSFSMTATYYTKEGNRIYTIEQLMEKSSYVYLHSFDYEQEAVGSMYNTFTLDFSKYSLESGYEDSIYYIKGITEEKLPQASTVVFDFSEMTTDEDTEISTVTANLEIEDSSIKITLTRKKISDIAGLSNGAFWLTYHTDTERSILFSTAAAIETQLTEYWNQAYSASKMCEYFLPEAWTPTSNQVQNNFFNRVISTNNGSAELLDTFIPDIKIYHNEKGESRLPKYNLSYAITPKIKYDPNQKYVLEDQQTNSTLSYSILLRNLAYRNAFEILYQTSNEDSIAEAIKKWEISEIGTTTYYYANQGGTKWEALVQDNIASGRFSQFSGWYVMAIRWLKAHYRNWKLDEYVRAKEQHNLIWNKLYQGYGHILLESKYTSSTATTSSDLMTEAQLYFKDKMRPEGAYSIAIIDAASLDNYDGAEIKVGDGIRIKAQEYYEQQDNLYQSLSQYLFITDIKYTLRSAANISLTVNSVKYADTIVKRLASLIK